LCQFNQHSSLENEKTLKLDTEKAMFSADWQLPVPEQTSKLEISLTNSGIFLISPTFLTCNNPIEMFTVKLEKMKSVDYFIYVSTKIPSAIADLSVALFYLINFQYN